VYHHGMLAGLPSITLTPRAPFDARPILGYYGRSPLEPLDIVLDGAWRRAVRLGEQKVLFEVAAGGTVDAPSLTVRLLATDRSPSDLAGGPRSREEGGAMGGQGRAVDVPPRDTMPEMTKVPSDDSSSDVPRSPGAAQERTGGLEVSTALLTAVAEAVARWWRIEQDPAELDEIAVLDPILGGLLARLHGARSPLMPSPFECLVWAILGQQITVAFAYKMKRALVEMYGESVEYEGRRYWLFPEAARLAEADPADLRELQFSRQKSDYVRSLAALVAEDRIDWDGLVTMPSDEAIKH
jgi:hypothetical protein